MSKLVRISAHPLTAEKSARIISPMVQKLPHFSAKFDLNARPTLGARGLALCALPPVGGFR